MLRTNWGWQETHVDDSDWSKAYGWIFKSLRFTLNVSYFSPSDLKQPDQLLVSSIGKALHSHEIVFMEIVGRFRCNYAERIEDDDDCDDSSVRVSLTTSINFYRSSSSRFHVSFLCFASQLARSCPRLSNLWTVIIIASILRSSPSREFLMMTVEPACQPVWVSMIHFV